MKSAALVLVTTAILLSLVDLSHKASADAAYLHPRSTSYVAGVLALTIAWAVAILATRSLSVALGGGILAGGAAGNLVSVALWPGVPNPIELGPIAFNLADVFVLAGFLFTAAATLLYAARNRDRLYEPIRLS